MGKSKISTSKDTINKAVAQVSTEHDESSVGYPFKYKKSLVISAMSPNQITTNKGKCTQKNNLFAMEIRRF